MKRYCLILLLLSFVLVSRAAVWEIKALASLFDRTEDQDRHTESAGFDYAPSKVGKKEFG